MATAFESSLSASALRPSADAPSMADNLPSVQFGFDDLRERMTRFTARFDAFIEQGRKRVLEERNQFRMNIAELREDQRMKERDIEILELKQQTHQQNVAKESQETSEMHAAIASLTTQRDERLNHRDCLRSQITALQSQITARRKAQAAHKRHLDSQSRFNEPELDFWEGYLGLRIEGAGRDDRLKFVYGMISEKDWEQEAWFELDTSERDYKVTEWKPKVEREEVDRVLERFNESRQLGEFLKGMRELFVDVFK